MLSFIIQTQNVLKGIPIPMIRDGNERKWETICFCRRKHICSLSLLPNIVSQNIPNLIKEPGQFLIKWKRRCAFHEPCLYYQSPLPNENIHFIHRIGHLFASPKLQKKHHMRVCEWGKMCSSYSKIIIINSRVICKWLFILRTQSVSKGIPTRIVGTRYK